MGVLWNEEGLGHAFGRHAGDDPVNRGLPVSHGQVHPSVRAEGRRQLLLHAEGGDDQGRALRGPNRGVGAGGPLRPGGQDKAFQQEPAQRPGEIEHALVAQKLPQITPDLGLRGRGGRSEINQKDGARGHSPHCGGLPAALQEGRC